MLGIAEGLVSPEFRLRPSLSVLCVRVPFPVGVVCRRSSDSGLR